MNDNDKVHSGGCLCGALRYEARGEPSLMGLCFCADCRKASGSGFIPFMGFPAEAVRFSGPNVEFRSEATGGRIATRNFCPSCGGLVFGGEIDKSDSFTIYAGSLDDASGFRPSIAIFTGRRPRWALLDPDLTVFEGPPG